MPPLRWGIVSCGLISSDFVNALQHLGRDKHVVVAVAARSLESAQTFAEKFHVSKFYDNYDALNDDPDVDVIYIGVINTAHLSAGVKALEARKPVLCEKPLCINVAETKLFLDTAKRNKVFLMEAMWSRFFPAYQELRTRLQRKELGDITHASAYFGVKIAHVERVNKKALGGGSMLDIGIYALNFILWVFGEEKPIEIKASGTLNDEGCEGDVVAVLKFSGDRYGTMMISTRSELSNTAQVTGTNGTMQLEAPFWCSSRVLSSLGDFYAPLDQSDRKYNFMNSQGLKYQAEEIARCLREGVLESAVMPHSSSLLLAEIIESIRRQIGVEI